MQNHTAFCRLIIALFCVALLFCAARAAFAYYDTMDGAVVQDAKAALEKKDMTPLLKWMKKDLEVELKQTFDNAQLERSKGAQEKDKADAAFFEAAVRLHPQGEGESPVGLKPTGTDRGAAVTGADKALDNGSVDSLVQLLTEEVNKGIRERFNNTFEKKKHADESVEAGRAYVEAYEDFLHYVEGLYLDAQGKISLREAIAKAESEGEHKQ